MQQLQGPHTFTGGQRGAALGVGSAGGGGDHSPGRSGHLTAELRPYPPPPLPSPPGLASLRRIGRRPVLRLPRPADAP